MAWERKIEVGDGVVRSVRVPAASRVLADGLFIGSGGFHGSMSAGCSDLSAGQAREIGLMYLAAAMELESREGDDGGE